MSGYGISGLIFNNLSLYLVNPQHVKAEPNGSYGEEVYQNVPYMIRNLAYCYGALVIVSVFLVFPGPPHPKQTESTELT